MKFDQGRDRWDLLPWAAATEVVRVLTFGAAKYAPDNWRYVDGWRGRYHAAALRHITLWWLGERRDPESGLHHLAHAIACLMFAYENELNEKNAPEKGGR